MCFLLLSCTTFINCVATWKVGIRFDHFSALRQRHKPIPCRVSWVSKRSKSSSNEQTFTMHFGQLMQNRNVFSCRFWVVGMQLMCRRKRGGIYIVPRPRTDIPTTANLLSQEVLRVGGTTHVSANGVWSFSLRTLSWPYHTSDHDLAICLQAGQQAYGGPISHERFMAWCIRRQWYSERGEGEGGWSRAYLRWEPCQSHMIQSLPSRFA